MQVTEALQELSTLQSELPLDIDVFNITSDFKRRVKALCRVIDPSIISWTTTKINKTLWRANYRLKESWLSLLDNLEARLSSREYLQAVKDEEEKLQKIQEAYSPEELQEIIERAKLLKKIKETSQELSELAKENPSAAMLEQIRIRKSDYKKLCKALEEVAIFNGLKFTTHQQLFDTRYDFKCKQDGRWTLCACIVVSFGDMCYQAYDPINSPGRLLSSGTNPVESLTHAFGLRHLDKNGRYRKGVVVTIKPISKGFK